MGRRGRNPNDRADPGEWIVMLGVGVAFVTLWIDRKSVV